ncbi:MAG: (2Fe-2S)-binding protein [Dehalococcoidales bacterium]|nr:(2Fe-2S)-binding protein [Dehalococcoidales bacterium]
MELAKKLIKVAVNGESRELWIKQNITLLDLLRDYLGLTGAKLACISNSCGACTVIVDDMAVKSCSVLAMQVDGKEVFTVEGLAKDNKLHPLQQAFIEHVAFQCGFCTPGKLMSAKALLDENPNPTEEELRRDMEGNLCRCTGYKKYIEAIMDVAQHPEKYSAKEG